MQSFKTLIAFIFITSLSAQVSAQQLWNGTAYGMSEDTIRNMFPEVTLVKNNNPGSGITSVHELNGIDLEGDIFKAIFFFKQGKLIRVSLLSENIKEIYWAIKKTNRLENILTYKYGTPYDSDDKTHRERFKYKNVHWKNGKTEITLSIYDTPPNSKIEIATIAIIYDAKFLDAASKL